MVKKSFRIVYKKVHPNAIVPSYAHDGDSGMDLFSMDEFELNSLERKVVGTGIALEIRKGYEGQIRSKSGLSLEYGIVVINSPGTIDSGYRGEIKVALFNASNRTYQVKKGSKVAQLVFAKVEKVELCEVDELDETSRGERGFGNAGLN